MNETSNATTIEELEELNIELENKNAQLEQQNAELTNKVNWLLEQFRLNQHKRYGSSREGVPEGQQQFDLFNEAEMESCPDAPEPVMETITYKRRKQKGHRDEILAELPEEIIEHHIPEEQRVCPQCDGHMHEMGFDERQELKFIPAQVKVVKHRYYKCACRNCEHNEIETPIIKAPAQAAVISGSLASPSAIAYIMNQKYVDSLPLYRQEQQLERLGIELSRQTLSNWMIKGADWLDRIYDRLHEELIKLDIIHADDYRNIYVIETGLQIAV